MFKKLKSEQELIECTEVLRKSFKTVADEFNLNQTNAPTHASNMTINSLKESIQNGFTDTTSVAQAEVIRMQNTKW
jgi:hypothetical protein